MTKPSSDRESAGGKVVVLLLGGLLLLAGGAYAAAYLAAGDKVPRGTTVAGVDIGGLTPAQAEEALSEGLADRLDRPIPVSVDGKTVTIAPSDAGLAVDVEATVAQAGGEEQLVPGRLWDYWTGGDEQDPVVTVDEPTLDAALDTLAESAGIAATDGGVAFKNGRVVVTDPAPGKGFDPDETRAALLDSYLSADDEVAELETRRGPARHRRRRRPGGPRHLRQPGDVRRRHAGLRRLSGRARAARLLGGPGDEGRGRRARARPRRRQARRTGRRGGERGRQAGRRHA